MSVLFVGFQKSKLGILFCTSLKKKFNYFYRTFEIIMQLILILLHTSY